MDGGNYCLIHLKKDADGGIWDQIDSLNIIKCKKLICIYYIPFRTVASTPFRVRFTPLLSFSLLKTLDAPPRRNTLVPKQPRFQDKTQRLAHSKAVELEEQDAAYDRFETPVPNLRKYPSTENRHGNVNYCLCLSQPLSTPISFFHFSCHGAVRNS